MKTLYLMAAAAVLAFVVGCGSDDVDAGGGVRVSGCGGSEYTAIAQLYATAVAYPEQLPAIVQNNAALFRPDSKILGCCQVFVNRLRAAALAGPSPGAIREKAYSIAGRAGMPNLGPKLAEDFMQDKADMMALANHLESLARVLPALARGETGPYYNTQLYATQSFVWQMSASSVMPQTHNAIRSMSEEISKWYVENLAAAM